MRLLENGDFARVLISGEIGMVVGRIDPTRRKKNSNNGVAYALRLHTGQGKYTKYMFKWYELRGLSPEETGRWIDFASGRWIDFASLSVEV